MKEKDRLNTARLAAEEYAPRPVSSYFMYGVVGACLAGLGLYAFATFYDVNLIVYPAWIALAIFLAFAGSIILRAVRSRRNTAAQGREYDKLDPN